MKKYLLAAVIMISACATKPPIDDDSYRAKLDRFSDGDVEYHGFQNTFKFRATLMNDFIQDIYIEQKAQVYKWDEAKKQEELAKIKEKNKSTTTVFMSFFTPRRQDNNLSSRSKSIWNIYLTTPSGRYEGKVYKYNVSPTEVMVLYPYHNSWATTYTVEFPVAVENIQNSPSEMEIAGPLGSKKVNFKAL